MSKIRNGEAISGIVKERITRAGLHGATLIVELDKKGNNGKNIVRAVHTNKAASRMKRLPVLNLYGWILYAAMAIAGKNAYKLTHDFQENSAVVVKFGQNVLTEEIEPVMITAPFISKKKKPAPAIG